MSKLTEFDIDDNVTVSADFKVNDALTDPTTISLDVTDPSGNLATYTYALAEVTRDAAGEYSKSIVADESGEWITTWTGTGACVASGTQRFVVRRAGA